ncbi:MAG: metallophosphoesterase family protein [Anaerolineae bacterium]|nr:metallophosphoesterase family protein [Anaerolineae bacterium]
MNLDQFAVISDIHGNSLALEAVLDDINARELDTIFNLGDHLYGSLEPATVAEMLIGDEIVSIAGNQDRIIITPPEDILTTADHLYIMSQLAQEHLDWLHTLPPTFRIEDVFLCHGTPDSDETYLLEQPDRAGGILDMTEAIQERLQGIDASLILCGHSHVPRCVWLPDGRLVVNPGSVGMPAYTDDVPYDHKMEAGSPHARYAVITRTANGWQVEQVAVAYDWFAAAAVARQRGRDDRARWLETGRA